jgi:uncharacterized protein (TIGR02271 family)
MEKRRPVENSERDVRHEEKTLPVMEENLRLGVGKIEKGKLTAKKKITEEDLIVSGPVLQDELSIERIPLNQYIDEAPPSVRYEGETMVIPVIEEEVVVQTRLRLVEEVRITRRQRERIAEEPVTIRREEVIIQRDGKPVEKKD